MESNRGTRLQPRIRSVGGTPQTLRMMNAVSRVRMDTLSFNDAQVSSFRLHGHHLDLRAPRSRLAGVVGDVCGVQAQVTAIARSCRRDHYGSLTAGRGDTAL